MKQYEKQNNEPTLEKKPTKSSDLTQIENQYRNLLQQLEDQGQTIEKLKRDISRLKDSVNILARKP